jgi:hypothetical protein
MLRYTIPRGGQNKAWKYTYSSEAPRRAGTGSFVAFCAHRASANRGKAYNRRRLAHASLLGGVP